MPPCPSLALQACNADRFVKVFHHSNRYLPQSRAFAAASDISRFPGSSHGLESGMRISWHFGFRRSVLGSNVARRRVPGKLLVERLEDRCLLSSTVSGYVFNDANDNGILDPGEKPIANIPLELRNAAGTVIASAVSDAHGYYQFVTDNTISTAP